MIEPKLTAATAALVESSRRRFAASSEAGAAQLLEELNARLARIEAAVEPEPSGR